MFFSKVILEGRHYIRMPLMDGYYEYPYIMQKRVGLNGVIQFEASANELLYDITDKATLVDYFKSTPVNFSDLKNIMIGILDIVIANEKCLLDYKCYMIDENYIYFNPLNKSIELMFLPFTEAERDFSEYKSMFLKWVYQSMSIHKLQKSHDIVTLVNSLQNDILNLHGLYYQLTDTRELKQEKHKKSPTYIRCGFKQKRIEKESFIIGRSSGSDFVIDDLNVSKKALELNKKGKDLFLRNVSVDFSLSLNNIPVQTMTEVQVFKGDIIVIGSKKIKLK